MIRVREARPGDAAEIRAIFEATYGEDYTYPYVYDEDRLLKLIFSDDTLMLVAVDEGEVLGTASVMLESGVEAAVMTRAALGELVRLRPDIGVVLYRNLARGLGEKLRRTDLDRRSPVGATERSRLPVSPSEG